MMDEGWRDAEVSESHLVSVVPLSARVFGEHNEFPDPRYPLTKPLLDSLEKGQISHLRSSHLEIFLNF
jgi:hypothetical protein